MPHTCDLGKLHFVSTLLKAYPDWKEFRVIIGICNIRTYIQYNIRTHISEKYAYIYVYVYSMSYDIYMEKYRSILIFYS